MRKRLSALLLALVWIAVLSACGAAPDSAETVVQLPVAQPSAELPPESVPPSAPPEVTASPEVSEVPSAPPETDTPPESSSEPPAEEPPELPIEESPEEPSESPAVSEDGWYSSKEEVALYIHLYGHLPDNYVSKREAQDAGWTGGSVEPYTGEGTAIGGSRFGNYEGLLPEAEGRTYTECDIDTVGRSSRGAKRVVFSNDGLIYYTGDHYESFELLYGGPEE